MVFFHTAGPNTALVKSSGKIVIGGRSFVVPILERVDKLSLSLRTLTVRTEKGTAINGVGVDVTSCCQVKIRAWVPSETLDTPTKSTRRKKDGLSIDMNAVKLAAQHFIGRSDAEINDTIRKTIEGHQRAIIGALTVEELYRDRQAFSNRVKEQCTEDMRSMGLFIVSYTVAEISDEQGYIEALGVRQTEKVKREATEGAARHREAARSKKAELDADAYALVNKEQEKMIASDRHRDVMKAEAKKELDRARAIQEKAHGIADAEQNAILLVERQKALAAKTEAERKVQEVKVDREILVKEATVNVDADARLYQAKVEADRRRVLAKARADRERSIAEAEAVAIREKGKAENERLKARMKVWKDCGNEAAILEKLLEALPEIAAATTEPLMQTDKIVFIDAGESEHAPPVPPGMEVAAAEMPETLSALTGTDMRGAVERFLAAGGKPESAVPGIGKDEK